MTLYGDGRIHATTILSTNDLTRDRVYSTLTLRVLPTRVVLARERRTRKLLKIAARRAVRRARRRSS